MQVIIELELVMKDNVVQYLAKNNVYGKTHEDGIKALITDMFNEEQENFGETTAEEGLTDGDESFTYSIKSLTIAK